MQGMGHAGCVPDGPGALLLSCLGRVSDLLCNSYKYVQYCTILDHLALQFAVIFAECRAEL